MSSADDLAGARQAIESWSPSPFGVSWFKGFVADALSPESPGGQPDNIDKAGAAALRTGSQVALARAELAVAGTTRLPAAWVSEVADTAAQDITALGSELANTGSAMSRAGAALRELAAALRIAQRDDQLGGSILLGVANTLGPFGLNVPPAELVQLRAQALSGVGLRLAGAQLAERTMHSTEVLISQLVDQARAEHAASSIDALSAVVLANQSGGGTQILTTSALDRATARLASLSPADQARFRSLLAGARSPEESAYLLKVLAAGHSVQEVTDFDAVIHSHGDDPAWLSQHLVPDIYGKPGTDGHYYSAYGGQNAGLYNQGQHNDCVAASTVIAQASVDPSVMLQLTTGNTSDGNDSEAAFEDRLQQMYLGQYHDAQVYEGDDPTKDGGIYPKGTDYLADKDLGNSTGGNYDYQSLDSDDDRQQAVGRIEEAVDQGKPVPLDIRSDSEGHQVMVIGHDGDRLQIYNPWGYTTWVTEDQFVHNDLGSITNNGGDGSLRTATGADIPS